MSTIEELNQELERIRSKISELKNQANEKKLPGKVADVAKVYDLKQNTTSGWLYCEKGLSVHYENGSVKVDLGHDTNDVFRAKLYANDVGEIYLYIPGEWEQRIQELYDKIPELRLQAKKENLEQQLSTLKIEWQLEG